MVTSPRPLKRKLATNTPVSPPPLRRKVQSTTTQGAVASFFTPASQKSPHKIVWQERAPRDGAPISLIVGKYAPSAQLSVAKNDGLSVGRRWKVAAFDFDSTLISTSSGKKFAADAHDWKWWHPSVPGILKKLHSEDEFHIVVLSNQGGISLKPDTKAPKSHMSKLGVFKTKVTAVFDQLDFPVSIYAATEKDIYRKPRTGMWKELLEDYGLGPASEHDLENSIFVGDAAGRDAFGGKQKDFSCSDRNFAENVGITFKTPEEFFLKETPRAFTRTFEPAEYLTESSTIEEHCYVKGNDQDLVLFCGSPGAGKSTFYWKKLKPLGYQRVNQDTLKTREKCLKVAGEFLKAGQSVVVDNTNADLDVRGKWVEMAKKHSVPIRCVLFTASKQVCEHNDVVRALNNEMNPESRTILPGMAFNGFAARYRRPEISEGFQDITEVTFKFNGSETEREIWSRHWT